MGAEPDTSSWQGGTLLELTAVGGGGGGGRHFGRVVSYRLNTESTVCKGRQNRAALLTDVGGGGFRHRSNSHKLSLINPSWRKVCKSWQY